MNKHLKYIWYLLRHKWYVALACWKYGCFHRAFTHDLSKLLPSEWGPYVNWFNGPFGVKFKRLAEDGTVGELEHQMHKECKLHFDYAWLHHQHRNLHHWQYWILRRDDGSHEALLMPEVYVREMVADWTGAGMAIHGKNECLEWYLSNRHKMHLHPKTRERVEELLGVPSDQRTPAEDQEQS